MNMNECEEIALMTLMQYKELNDWDFEFNNRKHTLGLCSHRDKKIYLSQEYVMLNKKEDIIDTIKHEIAHALVGVHHRHDYVWKSKARELGCTPKAASKNAKVNFTYIYECPNCKRTMGRFRALRSRPACKTCCNGTYNPKYIFVLKHHF